MIFRPSVLTFYIRIDSAERPGWAGGTAEQILSFCFWVDRVSLGFIRYNIITPVQCVGILEHRGYYSFSKCHATTKKRCNCFATCTMMKKNKTTRYVNSYINSSPTAVRLGPFTMYQYCYERDQTCSSRVQWKTKEKSIWQHYYVFKRCRLE